MAKAKIKDISILKDIFKSKDNVLALLLLDKAEFMEKTLKELQTAVDKNGVVTEMCQGSYSIDRTNPALQAYNNTIKNYTSVIKQLNDMLPKNDKPKDDGFDNF